MYSNINTKTVILIICLTLFSTYAFSYKVIEDLSAFDPQSFLTLYDFEQSGDNSLLVTNGEDMQISSLQAYEGSKSLRVVLPQYATGVTGWRFFELLLPSGKPSDWSDYRYLSMYILNESGYGQIFGLAPTITDLRTERHKIETGGWKREVYDLSIFEQQSDNGLQTVGGVKFDCGLHIYRIAAQTEFYIDKIELVKKSLSDEKAIQLFILNPKFRSNIYSTNPVTSGKVGVVLDVIQEDMDNITGNISITAQDGSNIFSGALQAVSQMQYFNFSIPGDKDLINVDVTVTDQRTNQTYSRHKEIKRMAPNDDEVIFDKDNNLLINGTPTFPVGIYFSSPNENEVLKDMKFIKENGFNCVGPYHTATDEMIAAASASGLRILPHFMEVPVSQANVKYNMPLLENSGALLGYYVYDEPHPYRVSASEVLALSQGYADQDPYHPTMTANLEDQYNYAGTSDIMMVDSYGLPGTLATLVRRLSAGLDSMKNYGPVWFIPQSFTNWSYCRGLTLKQGRPLTYDELRTETWLPIAMGAKGILYYNYYLSVPDVVQRIAFPEVWDALGYIIDEINLLKSVIFYGVDQPVTFTDTTGLIRVVAKKYNGDLYVIIVNGTEESQTIAADIQTDNYSSLYVLGEDRTVNFANGHIQDTFNYQTTRIYTSSHSAATQLSVTSFREEINRRQSARDEKGVLNYAWTSNGTTLTASWDFPSYGDLDEYGYCGSTPWLFMIDGNIGTKWTIGDDAYRSSYVWPDSLIYKGTRWLDVNFNQQRTLAKVNIAVSTDLKYQLQIWQDNQWNTIPVESQQITSDRYHQKLVARMDVYDLTNVTTDKLRLLFTEDTPKTAAIFEIQASGHAGRFYGFDEDKFWANPSNWDAIPGSGDSVNIKSDCILDVNNNVEVGSILAPWKDEITFDVLGNLTVKNGSFVVMGDSVSASSTVNIKGSVKLKAADADFQVGYGQNTTGIVNVNGGVVTTFDILDVGYYGNGTFNMSGNAKVSSYHTSIAVQSSSTGQLVMNSGNFDVVGNISVGVRGQGDLEVNGGTINANKMYVGNSTYGGSGAVRLVKGIIHLNDFIIQSGTVDIEEAVVFVNGDIYDKIDGYISSGVLTGYGNPQGVHYFVDSGKTIICTLPCCSNPPMYDTNFDCKIDLLDFANMAQGWMKF